MMKNIDLSSLILNNELEWMESIGCKIKKCSNNIFISHPYNNSIDFNFVAVYSNDFLPSSKCYRISNKTNSQLTKIEILKNYIPEYCFDINFIFNGTKSSNGDFRFSELNYEHWKQECEIKRKKLFNAHYYFIWYKNLKIGKFSTIEDDEIIGIYDYEINPIFRRKGLGSKFLKSYCSVQNKLIFIQTWSENLAAIKCYKKAGFATYEILYRYVSYNRHKRPTLYEVYIPKDIKGDFCILAGKEHCKHEYCSIF